MSYRRVQEVHVTERDVKVCRLCSRPLPAQVANRGAYRMGGSIAGSLGASYAGSAVAGTAAMVIFPPAAFVVGLAGI